MPLVLPGQEVGFNEPRKRFPRHHHLTPYAAVLVDGECEEAGDHGRFSARPGDVLAHRSFDGHADRIGAKGAVFINIPLRSDLPAAFGRIADLDAFVRACERDLAEGEWILRQQFTPNGQAADWPDLLARDLAGNSRESVGNWAVNHGLAPESVSRGFRLAYGTSPKRFRLEQMARRAAQELRCRDVSLADVAIRAGFADQPHMTRTLSALFGATPRTLRSIG
jgi:AraC-like DNA-binding protein